MADNFSIQVSADTSKAESEIDKLTKQKRKIDIDAELNTSEIENQLKQLSNRKIQLDIEVGTKDQASKIAKDIERGLRNTKIDASGMAKSLADSFNISDKSVIKKMQSQINGMMSNLASTWNGKNVDLTKASGFYSGIDDLGKTVAQNAKIIESKLGIYDEFYNYAKNKRIYVSDDLKKALGGDEYKELLKNNVGKITKDATRGLSIDSLWGELTTSFPEHFSDTIANQADQLRKYFDVLKSARADITKMVSTSDMTPQQLIGVSDDAFQHVVDLAGNIRDKLVQNLNNATEKSKTTFDLDIDINTEKIVADIRNALSQINSGEAVKISLDIDKNEIETQIRSAIQSISSTNTPLDIDINIDKQSIEADLKAALHNIDLPIQFKIDASDIESQIRAAVSAINDIQIDVHVNADDIRNEIMQGLDNNPVQIPAQIDDNPLENINRSGQEGIDIFTGLGGAVRDAFSAYTLANLLERGLDKVVDAGREAIDTVKELDDASLQLQLATGATREEAKSMISDYRDLGNELGNLTQNVAESADEWLRQGRTIEETNTLIADSVKLATIGQLSSSDASEYLTSSMKGYNVAVDDVIGIVDKLGAVDLSAAVSAGGLAEGMSRVAVTANTAGISMDKLLGYLAVMGETSGRSMESVGTALRTVLLRMQDIKSGKLELVDEDGTTELLSDVETTLKNVGIDLRSTVTDFNNLGEVLDNLSNRWGDLNSTQQAALTKALGGQRQGEFVKILMENYDTAKKYMDISANSSGMADEKFSNYLDSLEAKTNKLKNSLEALAADTITDGLYEGFLETATAAADFARETDLVNTALIGLGTAGTTYVFRNLSTMIANTVTQVNALGGGLSGLWGVMSAHPIALVTAGVVAAVGAWNLYQSTVKSANEKMAESFSAYEQAQSEVENVNNELLTTQSRIDELNAKQSLTFVEQSELEKLQEANEKLQLQLDLREKEEQRAARQASEDTVSAYEKTYGKYGISESKTKEYINNAELTGNNAILLSDENNISAMIAGIRQMQKLRQDAFNSNNGEEVERYDEIINDATDSVWEQVTALEEYKSKLEAVKEAGGSLNTEEQNTLSEIESTIEYVYKQLDPEKWNQMQFDNIFNQSRFSDAKESLKQIAKESDNIGISAEEVKNKFPELVAEMQKAGYSAQDIANNINSELGLLDFDKVKKQLQNAYADILGENPTAADLKKSDYRNLEMQKFLQDKTDEEIEIFYKYVNDGDIDLSELTLEDIQELFIKINADTTPAQQSLEELTQSANDVVSSINSINSVLSSQGTGTSISSEIFSDEELKDYSSALEYVNGCYQLNTEKVKKLTEAKVDEAIAANNTKKAIEQQNYLKNAKEIDSLRKKIEENNFAQGESAESIQLQIDSLLESNSAIISNCNQLDVLNASLRESIGVYQQWKDAQSAGNSGDMYDDAKTAWSQIRDIADKESDMYGRVGTVQYQASVDFLIPEEIDHSDQKAVQDYLDSIRKYMYFDDNGDVNGINMDNFFKSAVDKGLMVETEDSYEIAGQMTMQKFAEGMGMSLPLVQAIFGEIEEFMPEGEQWFDWSDEAVQSLGDLAIVASDAADALQSTEQFKNMDIQIDVSDLSTTEEQISALDATIEQMNQVKATPGVDTSQIEDANAIIQYCVQQKQALNEPAVMSVDTSLVEGQIGEAISLLQQFQQAQNELEMQKTLGLDTSEAESKVSNLTTEIQALNPKVTASLGIDPASTETIASTISALTPELMVEAGVDDKAIIGYTPDDKKATVVYDVDHRKVDAYNPQNLDRNVTYHVITQGTVPTGGTLTSGSSNNKKTGKNSANGTAHAYGTALADGVWGAKQGGMALVGELGREVIVDPLTGKWRTVGDNGAEFTYVPKHALVFNHLQTEALLKNGYVTSRAQAFVSGTAFASGNAMVTGSVPKNVTTIQNKNQTSTEKTSSKSKKSTTKNTKAVNKNTAAINKNTKAIEESQDWISVKLDRISKQLDEYKTLASDYYQAFANQNKMLDTAINQVKANIQTNEQAYMAYMQKANSIGLDAGYKQRVMNGEINIETITDENLKNLISEFQDFYEKAQDCREAIIDLKNQIVELSTQKIDNILDDYDAFFAMSDSIYGRFEAENKLFDAMGKSASEYNLQMMLNQRNNQVMYSRGELEDLVNLNNSLLQSGDIRMWSQEWYDLQGKIHDVYTQIYEAETEVYELRQQIREVRWEPFRKAIEDIDAVNDNLENTLSLISDLEAFGKDSDTLNMNGKLQLGLLTKQLGNARQAVAEYENAFKALDNELASGILTQEQYDEQLKELNEGRWEAVSSVKKYRDAILDLVKDGINKETEAMQKLVDARKKDLQAQKDAADYARTLRDKTTEINKIKAQIASLQGDDRATTKAQLRNLQNQLKEKEQDLQDTQDDHAFDVLQEGYDNAMEKFEEIQENELYLLNSNLEAQNEAIANMLMVARDNYQEIYNELNEIAEVYGMKLSSDIVSPWTTATEAVNAYKQAVGDVYSQATIDTSPINGVSGNTDYVRYEENNNSAPDNNVTQQQQSTTTVSGKISDVPEVLQYGSQGNSVKLLQTALNGLGYNCGEVDGSFGDQTLAAVKRFQKSVGMAGDGIVGDNTKAHFRARGYKKGSPNTQKGLAYYDEEGLGSEVIITDKGVLRQFNAGETIFNAEQAKYLYDTSKYAVKHNFPNVQTPSFVSDLVKRDTSVHIDSLVNIEGNVTEEVYPKVEKMIKTAIKDFDRETRRKIYDNYRKVGGQFYQW